MDSKLDPSHQVLRGRLRAFEATDVVAVVLVAVSILEETLRLGVGLT